MKLIIPTILLILSIGSFLSFTNPTYQKVKELRAKAAEYDTALGNSRKLQEERDNLGTRYRAFQPDQLARLNKLLPDNADNIRLIIDIQQMAQSYGMNLTAIKFNPVQTAPTSTQPAKELSVATQSDVAQSNQDYGVFDLTFSTTATTANFLKFTKDIESSLRLTDIQSIDSTLDETAKGTSTYTVKLRTYWLKH